MKLAVTIPTYKRSDGTTPKFLQQALKSVLAQTHQDYKVFLIGDDYTDNKEFEELAHLIPENKVYKENLSIALERSKYPPGSRELWCSGGVNARNHSVKVALKQGYNFVCPLDHDDYWAPDHLESINSVVDNYKDVAFVYTCSSHIVGYLPQAPLDNKIIMSLPQPCQLIHSSVCINYDIIQSKYRDVNSETGQPLEADADLWMRISQEIQTSTNKKLKSILVKKLTCFHKQEKH